MKIEDPYAHLQPKRAAGLTLGCKTRYANGVVSMIDSANRMFEETFLPHEIELIKEIVQNVKDRARKTYEETLRHLDTTVPATAIGSGAETQHRQYNGK